MPDSSFTLRRGALETLVIVLGVLIALGADAAWAWRVERVEEQEALERLHDDFTASLEEIEAGFELYVEIAAGLDGVLEAIARGGVPAGSGLLPDSTVVGAYRTSVISPPRGALQSLIASGEIGIIRNETLRSALTSWFDVLALAQTEDAEDRRVYEQILMPLMWPVTSFRSVIARSEMLPDLEPSTLPSDNGALLRSVEFESVLAWRRANASEAIERYVDLRTLAERIVALIEAELGEARDPAPTVPTPGA